MQKDGVGNDFIVDDVDDDVRAAYAALKEQSAGAGGGNAGDEITPAQGAGGGDSNSSDPAGEAADPKDDKGQQPRADDGKFKAKDPKDGADPKDGKAPDPAAKKPVDPAEKTSADPKEAAKAPVDAPPGGWSVKSKTDWAKLKEQFPHIHADVLKREGEVAQGLSALKEFRDLKPYQERAQKEGMTLNTDLDRIVRMEDLLSRDLGTGLMQIAHNKGMTQQAAAQLFANLAIKLGYKASPGTAPTNGAGNGGHPASIHGMDTQNPAADPLIEAMRPVLGPILQEVNSLKGMLTARQQADQQAAGASLEAAIEKFSSDPKNIYFSDVEDKISELFETGMVKRTGDHTKDLQTAYDLAVRMDATIQEALIEQRLAEARKPTRQNEQEAAGKARAASRSMSGSAMPGTTIRRVEKAGDAATDDVEEDVRRAYRAVTQT